MLRTQHAPRHNEIAATSQLPMLWNAVDRCSTPLSFHKGVALRTLHQKAWRWTRVRQPMRGVKNEFKRATDRISGLRVFGSGTWAKHARRLKASPSIAKLGTNGKARTHPESSRGYQLANWPSAHDAKVGAARQLQCLTARLSITHGLAQNCYLWVPSVAAAPLHHARARSQQQHKRAATLFEQERGSLVKMRRDSRGNAIGLSAPRTS